MNVNNLYLKFEKTLGRKKIDDIVNQFTLIKNQLFEDRNIELVIGGYLELEVFIIKKQQEMNRIRNEMLDFEMRKKELLNYSVIRLRKENRLVNWLSNLEISVISQLNTILDIQEEYNKVDMMKFHESKSKRGITL